MLFGDFFKPRKMVLSAIFFVAIAGATLLPTDAVETKPVAGVNSATLSATTVIVTETAPVDYSFPYPGILPDSPLYFLKVTRDKLMTVFIQNPTDRAFYLLFLSDKRFAAGQLLLGKKDSLLGAQTLLSAEEYLAEAVTIAEKLPRSPQTSDLVTKLTVATAKHRELLTATKGSQSTLLKARTSSTKSYDRVRKLLLAKI